MPGCVPDTSQGSAGLAGSTTPRSPLPAHGSRPRTIYRWRSPVRRPSRIPACMQRYELAGVHETGGNPPGTGRYRNLRGAEPAAVAAPGCSIRCAMLFFRYVESPLRDFPLLYRQAPEGGRGVSRSTQDLEDSLAPRAPSGGLRPCRPYQHERSSGCSPEFQRRCRADCVRYRSSEYHIIIECIPV